MITDGWTYTGTTAASPLITSIFPTCGPRTNPTSVLITGTNLEDVTQVTIAGVDCVSIQHPTLDTQITCITGDFLGPNGTAGDVIAVNAFGQGVLPAAWTYDDA